MSACTVAALLLACCLAPAAPAQFVPDDPLYDSGPPYGDGQWNLRAIGMERAWEITTGSPGVVVAVIDVSTNTSHEDLVGALWTNPGEVPGNGVDDDGNGYVDDVHGWDFGTDSPVSTPPHSHGAPVASIILARTDNATGIAGVAGGGLGQDGVHYMFLNYPRFDAEDEIADALDYARLNGADIVNMSLTTDDTVELSQALDDAIAAEMVLVGSSGNGILSGQPGAQPGDPASVANPCYSSAPSDPYDGEFPARVSGVLSVGATLVSGERWPLSCPAADTDGGVQAAEMVMAPGGTDIPAAADTGDSSYDLFGGTSASAPHVSGVAALLLSVKPALSRDQVYEALLETADPTGCPIDPSIPDDQECGRGVVNAYAALQYVLENFGGHLARGLTIPAGETWTPGAVAWTFGQGTGLTVEGTLTASGTTFEADGGTWTGLRADGGTATLTGVTVSDVSHCAFPPFCSYQPERSVVEAVGGATVTLTGGSVIEGGEAANGVLALGKGSTVTVEGGTRISDTSGYGAVAFDFGSVIVQGAATQSLRNDAGGVLADGEGARVTIRDQAVTELSKGYGATAIRLGRVVVEPTVQTGNTRISVNDGGLAAIDGGFVDAGDCKLADCDDRGQPNDLSFNDPDGLSPPQDSPSFARDARAVGGSTVTALYGFWGQGRTTVSDLDLLDDAASVVYVTPLAPTANGLASGPSEGGASKTGDGEPSPAVRVAAQARRLAERGDAGDAWALLAGPLVAATRDADRQALFMAAASFADALPPSALAVLRAAARSETDAAPWAARVLAVVGDGSVPHAQALTARPVAPDGHAAFGHRALVARAVADGDAEQAVQHLAGFTAAVGAEPSEADAERLRAAAALVAVAFDEAGEVDGSPPDLGKTGPFVGAMSALGLSVAPNPAQGRVSVALRTDGEQTGTVRVFDALGRRVVTLHNGRVPEGGATLALDATRLAPGVYTVVARLDGPAGATVETARLTVVR